MRYLLLAFSLAFVACGSSSDDSSDKSTNDTVGAEIAEDFNKTMDKAEDVEQKLLDSKSNIDAALKNAEGAVEEDEDGVKGE